ncbi:MAG: flagellar hook-basal body complex protein FliE [Myxococcota bacterium]
MTAPIGLPETLGTLLPNPTVPAEGADPVTPFVERLEQVAAEADAMQKEAAEMSEGFAEGRHNDIHGTMIAMSHADISLRFAANVRNRVIEAYREVMRMGA